MALISCFSRCRTFAGSIARGKSVECLAGCSRCKTTLSRGHRSAVTAIAFSSASFAFAFAADACETVAGLLSDLDRYTLMWSST